MKYIIGYHDNCNDGLMAAATMLTAIDRKDVLAFIPLDYSEKSERELIDAVDIYKNSKLSLVTVIIVDYCPKHDCLHDLSVAQQCSDSLFEVIVLDHHVTSIAKEAELPSVYADMRTHEKYGAFVGFMYREDMSGAGLAWNLANILAKRDPSKHPARKVVRLVQDRDLWLFNFGAETKQFHAYTRLIERTPDAWYNEFLVESLIDPPLSVKLEKGAKLIAEDNKLISAVMYKAKNTFIISTDYIIQAAIFTCERKDLVSEICDRLLTDNKYLDVALCATEAEGGGYNWSVRSAVRTPDHICAKEIAIHFGGGGHRNAAGFHTKTFDEVVGYDTIQFSEL